MTPAERDEARALAQAVIDAPESTEVDRSLARAVLRYVPPGDAPNETMWTIRIVRHQRGAVIKITGDDAVCAPDSARRLAHAIHAAADAAEES